MSHHNSAPPAATPDHRNSIGRVFWNALATQGITDASAHRSPTMEKYVPVSGIPRAIAAQATMATRNPSGAPAEKSTAKVMGPMIKALERSGWRRMSPK
jgi:predicted oxidoreductase (fatty acid repression mutant protein)